LRNNSVISCDIAVTKMPAQRHADAQVELPLAIPIGVGSLSLEPAINAKRILPMVRQTCYHLRSFALTAAVLLGLTAPVLASQGTLSVYVREGLPTGHVFVRLSDGKETLTLGFYPIVKSPEALIGGAGGELRSDADIKDWAVMKEFALTPAGHERARAAIEQWKRDGKPWSLNSHCGDFALAVLLAGIEPAESERIGRQLAGRTRPGSFAAFLRNHGGVTNTPVASHP
jgi:hypothetical protein